MKKANVEMQSGACGFKVRIDVDPKDKSLLDVKVESTCPHVSALTQDLQDLDWRKDVFTRADKSRIYQAAGKHIRHLDCPVPVAIIKAIQVATGMALPQEVSMKISTDEGENKR